MAGRTILNFCFRLYAGAVKSPQVVDFLQALTWHIGRPLLIVWNRLAAHRGRLVRDYVDSRKGGIEIAYLPPYAPELNPVEYIWADWKQHELPNVCPKDYWPLSEAARRTLRRMRRRRRLITALRESIRALRLLPLSVVTLRVDDLHDAKLVRADLLEADVYAPLQRRPEVARA